MPKLKPEPLADSGIAAVIAEFEQLARLLDALPGEAARATSRMLRSLIASKGRFNAEAALGFDQGWRAELMRETERGLCEALRERLCPGATPHRASNDVITYLNHYKRTDFRRDRQAGRRPKDEDAPAFALLTLKGHAPSERTLQRIFSPRSAVAVANGNRLRQPQEAEPIMALSSIARFKPAPPIDPDEESRAADEVRNILSARGERVSAEMHRLRLDDHFRDRDVSLDDPNEAHMRKQLAQLNQLPPMHAMVSSGIEGKTPAIARALSLASGAPLEPSQPLQEKIQRLEAESREISRGLSDAIEVCDRLGNERSTRLCEAERPEWNGRVTKIVGLLRDACREMSGLRQHEARIVTSGVTFRGHVLPLPEATRIAMAVLGDETDWGSPISVMVREAISMGLIKE